MKKLLYTIQFLATFFLCDMALAQNALDFDGLDDQISVPNASGLIVNSNLSLSFWVYPTDPAPAFPLFDGMAGFRNDADADFYILHLTATSVEARFRNSSGLSFDLVYNGVNLNQWNHFALTYDGTKLTLYHNGEHAAAISASGYILNAVRPLNMGFLPYSINTFALDGRLDDVCLWSKALSNTEVSELYGACSVNLNADGLKLAYEFNQGLAGSDNTAITTAIDSKGNIDGPMTGFALTGNSSNFVEYLHSGFELLSESVCNESYTSPSGNYVWNTSGSYTDTIFGSACTEVFFINLSVQSVDTSVIEGPGSLTAVESGANYQWIDCETGEPVDGAEDQTFVALESGHYALVITKNACSDTSACYSLIVDATTQALKDEIDIYPNPFEEILFIKLGPSTPPLYLEIRNSTGQVVWTKNSGGAVVVKADLRGQPTGVYYLLAITTDRTGVWKLVKF
ncbi:MAG: T9SS type A sorting domain-containing protein [Saprospirales bacterium]|nr:T9SS type A sorting domain-containing protein [Saprospirales bacterium]